MVHFWVFFLIVKNLQKYFQCIDWKKIHISLLILFKLMLFIGQLYYPLSLVTIFGLKYILSDVSVAT